MSTGIKSIHTPRSLDALVSYQVHRWEFEEKARTARREGPLPCVAISRLPWSGGEAVAHTVAEWLGFGYFGIEIVDRIAREEGIQRELVAGVDEHVRSTIDRWVIDAFRRQTFKESDYLRGIIRTVATLGERGMAVILGRGSPFILGAERALRVLVVASQDWRRERLAQEEGVSTAEAAERLARADESRRDFLRTDFKVDPDDPTLYDLVVNPATLGVEGAAELVVQALRRRLPEMR